MKKINEVSGIVGVSKRTLQYYDDEGILPVQRAPHNHRVYDQQTLEQIWQILIYKEMDFELNEIKDLIKLPPEQKEIYFIRQMKKIENKIIGKKVQLKFILLALCDKFPIRPEECLGTTYREYIEKLKDEMKEEIMEGAKENEDE